jgi:dephospho-CoA kinase
MERLMRYRGLSAEEARARLAAQSPQAEKLARADVVIDTSGDLHETRRQVMAAWEMANC